MATSTSKTAAAKESTDTGAAVTPADQIDENLKHDQDALKNLKSDEDKDPRQADLEDHIDGLKDRKKDASATEGDFDTTADPDTMRDTFGDVVTTESGGAIAQPLTTSPVTYTDNRGVERIAGGFDDGWVPAPVDPDPAHVRQNEAAMERIRTSREDTARRQGELHGDAVIGADEKANEENRKAAKKQAKS